MKKAWSQKKIPVVLTLALALAFLPGGLFGCSQTEQAQSSNQSGAIGQSAEDKTSLTASESFMEFGTKTATAIQVKIINATGLVITGVAIKATIGEADAITVVPMGTKIDVNETFVAYFEPSQLTVQPSDGASSDIILKTLYQGVINFADGTAVVVHDLNLSEISELRLRISMEGLGYVEYTNSSGQRESTLESEKALRDAEEAAVKAAAEAAEAAAAEEAAAQAAAQNQPVYDYGGSSGGSYSGGQSADQCVDDLVLK